MALLSIWEDLNPNKRRNWRKRQRYPLIELMDELSDLDNFPFVLSTDGLIRKRKKLTDNEEEGGFYLELEEAKGFTPDELTVKVKGREVEIAGKHEEKDEEAKSYVYREFRRSFPLPKNVDSDSVSSELSNEGILRIRASPTRKQKTIKIPVEREDKTDNTEKSATEEEKINQS